MDIHCIGTGGGRFCLTTQQRATGGFMIEHEDTSMYVDPGPGALVRGLDHGITFGSVDALFISHAHIDHYGDGEALIEAITQGCKKDRGHLITNEIVLEGQSDTSGVLSSYHRNHIGQTSMIDAEDIVDLEPWSLTVTATDHKDIQTNGFCAEIEGTTIGYIPDTSYTDDLIPQYRDADYLIINTLRPVDKDWKGHLNLEEAVNLVETIEPEKAFLQHFGMNFVTSFRTQVEWLQDYDPAVPITLCSDMTTYSLEDQGLEQFV